MNYWGEMIFRPLYKMIYNIKAQNDKSLILESLNNGDIFYSNGYFKAVNKFSNALYMEFKSLGAEYIKTEKGFKFEEMPKWLEKVVTDIATARQIQLQQINSYLQDLELNLNHYVENMIFDDEVERILYDANGEIKARVKGLNVIEPELTKQQAETLAKDYTNNMQLSIKKWTSNNISNMRQEVQSMVLDGLREDSIRKLLTTKYDKELYKQTLQKQPKNLSKKELEMWYKKQKRRFMNKAKFLAQNETSILLNHYKKESYQAMGFNEFIWNTIMDTHERQLHADLNGRIFSFDSPPIVDDRTGQRGIPGDAFGCRCSFTPIRRDSVFNNV